MHDRSKLIEARIRRLIDERVLPAIYSDARPLEITAWAVPGEPVPFADAVGQEYDAFSPGELWGRPWGTVWFHVTGTVPAEWSGRPGHPEVIVDLGFMTAIPGFQAEGTVYRGDGTIMKAVESRNQYVRAGKPGDAIDLYVEAAANPNVADFHDYQPTKLGDLATAGDAPLYRLARIDVALRDDASWQLAQDLTVLSQLAAELPTDLPRRAELLRAMELAADALDPNAVAETAPAARAELAAVFASPAYASAHRITAVGHAHIDSAWLWPVRETVRKVARTFSNVLALMDDDPEFVFAASSAQQYAWLKQRQPELFERLRKRVAEGRFVPVGGMWVESDTNLPGGEALARQFVMGKRFFIEELGVEPLEVWLPDSFGYSAALPQIVAAAGSKWFLTQKLSWNDTNRIPHHTFLWEGIDGSRIFTHFPPVDTYNAEITAAELAHAQRQYGEKGRANSSLVPYGWGNGGGGPTREMVAAVHRTGDLEGSPSVTMQSPRAFFEQAEAEYEAPPVWRGELYLEAHRGTYTSQANMKKGNRRSEHLLREAELWASLAAVRTGAEYPYEELESLWRTVLLQQFHDILPGTAIAWVHQEAQRNYADVTQRLEALITASIATLAGTGSETVTFNAGPRALAGVPALGASVADSGARPAWASTADGYVIENARVRASIDKRGLLVSLFDTDAQREVIPPDQPGNLLQLFRDTPTQWDAWDIDADYARVVEEITAVSSLTVSGDALVIERAFGASTIRQELRLDAASGSLDIATSIDWHERQKLLKLAFPLAVFAERSTSEIQFGHIHRPTHANTSWDSARYETVAQRWVHVAEPGYGVAVGNDSSYGYDIRNEHASDGTVATIVRVSLLRAPLYPDPETDQGRHEFGLSVRAGSTISDAVELGYRLNLPAREVTGAPVDPVLTIDNPAIVVEAVKLADDRSGDVVVRLYEALGSTARGAVVPGFEFSSVVRTDLLERPYGTASTDLSALRLRPFEVVTLRFAR